MNTRQSGNEIIEETKKTPEAKEVVLFSLWKLGIERAVTAHGKTMDDKIFILDDAGKEYIIDPDMILDTKSDAYDRAMKGI